MIRKSKFRRAAIVLLSCICILLIFRNKLIYETGSSSQTVELFNGDTITLVRTSTGPRCFPIPFIVHGGFTLGKKPWIYEYEFEHNGQTVHMKSQENWLLLNLFENEYFVWAKDPFSGQGYSTSNLYRYDQSTKSWRLIDRTQFPKAIAVRNLNLSTKSGRCDTCGLINNKEIARNLDPSNHHFDDSSTAHLWLFLETGTHLERSHWDVNADLLKEFKEKYIHHPVPIK